MKRPEGLPDYQHPPLVEVVLGVQFEPLEGFTSVHYGRVSEAFEDEFPIAEDKQPLPPVFELPRSPSAPRIEFQSLEYVLPRLWLVKNDRSRLLQIQSDRFHMNWRAFEGDGIYPRYESMRQSFETCFKRFSEVLQSDGLGVPRVNQVEVTYVNHLDDDAGAELQLAPERFLNFFKQDPWSENGAEVETVNLKITHRLTRENGEWAGRMHLSVNPVKTEKKDTVLSMNLTVRGKPIGENISDALKYMDFSRKIIVERFTATTTKKMHAKWGRKQ